MIVDGSNVEHAKPAPDLFRLAAERLGVDDVARCWCVGDATWDVLAALAAGMVPVGVTAGSAVSDRELLAAGAALVVGSLADLVALPRMITFTSGSRTSRRFVTLAKRGFR